jgi:hypothetical protein
MTGSMPQHESDAHALYPRVYPMAPSWRRTIIVVSACLAVFMAVMTVAIAADPSPLMADDGMAALWILALGMAGLCILAILYTLRWRIVLYDDAIEAVDLFRRRHLQRDEIVGWRVEPPRGQGAAKLVLESRGAVKTLHIPQFYAADAAWEAWFAAIHPRLLAEAITLSEAEIAAAPEFGDTPEHRLRHLAFSRKAGRGLNAAAWAVLIWFFYFREHDVVTTAIIVAMPWLAVLLVSATHGLFRLDFDAPRSDAHPNLAVLVIGPALALSFAAVLSDAHFFIGWTRLSVIAAPVTAALALAIFAAERALRRRALALVGFLGFAMLYAVGASLWGDIRLDRSRPQVFSAEVLHKFVSGGRYRTYNLRLAPWGPQVNAATVIVAHSTYDAIGLGNRACVSLFNGALGFPWFVATTCQAGRYGAIAYGRRSGAWGYAVHRASQAKAESFARENCARHGNDCEVIGWFEDKCGAVASGEDANAFFGLGDSDGQARADARDKCAEGGSKVCEVRVSQCSK